MKWNTDLHVVHYGLSNNEVQSEIIWRWKFFENDHERNL